MTLDWNTIDRWLMGEAFVGSSIAASVDHLCNQIGVRWGGSQQEREATQFSARCLEQFSGSQAVIEEFPLTTCNVQAVSLRLADEPHRQLDARPCLFCPPIDVQAPLVDVGFGMPNEVESLDGPLQGVVALIRGEFEPFSDPQALTQRLDRLAALGVVAAIVGSPHGGRRLSHMPGSDWRDDPTHVALPLIQTSSEDAARLRSIASTRPMIAIVVESEMKTAVSWNAYADLAGTTYPEESLVLGAHHDTTPDSFGANDNVAGVAVLLETARLLAGVAQHHQARPGRTIRFVSFGSEEQGLQGSTAFVRRHYGPEPEPRLMMALDELATGDIKGVVLQFPELRSFVQQHLDSMNEGLQCHVLTQLDASGDMFPFARQGIPSSFLWRWRFVGRRPETSFGHSNADTPEKLNLRELKVYAGILARLLLRLSHASPVEWPENRLDVAEIARRLERERGSIFRTM